VIRRTVWQVSLVALGVAPVAAGQVAPVRPWSDVAIDDLHFIRAILRENHPGPLDTVNPWFRDWFEQGFPQAVRLAERAQSYEGYYFAIQYYMNGFQDGHLGALGDDRLAEPKLERRWPGFLLRLAGDDLVVHAPRGTNSPVRPGSRLVECDGRPAAAMAEEVLRTYVGLWSVRGVRPRLAPYLLIDEGNPFVRLPGQCRFGLDGRETVVTLVWTPVSNQALAGWMREIDPVPTQGIGLRAFGDRRYWISLPSFAGGDTATAAALLRLRDQVAANAPALQAAGLIVFDVRGNGGGNSQFGEDIAAALWGTPFIDAVRPRASAVDWRASAGNARFLRGVNLRRIEQQFGPEAAYVREYGAFVAAMDAVVARGDAFLRQTPESATAATPPPNPVQARVVLLTDSHCFSACLDFADLLRAIPGAVHAGQETSADAVYIDNRAERLPSGEGFVGFSMKVYRGRPRGHNRSYLPAWPWEGSMSDTGALERWLAQKASEP
jgi:hypothetical protein